MTTAAGAVSEYRWLSELQSQCHSTAPAIHEPARINACVAATTICGGTYTDVARDWAEALDHLQEKQREMRRHENTTDGWTRADGEFFDRVNHAIRSWDARCNDPDPDEEEIDLMATTKRKARTRAEKNAGIPETQDQAAAKEAAAAATESGQLETFTAWRKPKRLAEWTRIRGRAPTVDEFSDIVSDAARDVSRTLRKPRSPYDVRDVCLFTVTKARRAELDCENVPQKWGGQPSPRAFNVALWDTLQREAKKRQKRAAAENGQASTATATGSTRKPAPKPAGVPRRWDIERRKCSWYQRQIAERLQQAVWHDVLRVLLLFSETCTWGEQGLQCAS